LIATMVEELRAGLVANTYLTLDQIKSRLTELGVDVTKIFTTEESELELKLEGTWEQIIRALQARLNGAGMPWEPLSLLHVSIVQAFWLDLR